MFLETLKLAFRAIKRNPLRSFLTVLGIVIGVAAVIAMVTVGKGTTAKITADMAKLGSNLLFVRPGQFGPGRASTDAKPFNIRDIEALRAELAGVQAIAPVSQKSLKLIYGGQNHTAIVTGTDNEYFTTQDWLLTEGRQFLDGKISGGRAACIVGATVRKELFGLLDPIGRSLRVATLSCEIIGLLGSKGQSSTGTDQDDIVVMPLRAFQRRIAGNTDIHTISISARADADTAKVQADTERLLRERRNVPRGQEDDFNVRDMRQIVQTTVGTTNVLTGLLGSVAAVSLLVGGIGIMNIMLVSVTERTREIGIRLAIGALESQVLMQFLVEAVALSLFGGLIGIGLGLGLAWLAAGGLKIPFVIDGTIIFIAFSFSALVGVIFGYFPAQRASRMNPIEALRHE